MLYSDSGATGSNLLAMAEVGDPNFDPSAVVGHTYYVATNGSDTYSGRSTQPFRTIQKAADIVNPGDTVIVRDGVYSGPAADQLVLLTRSGTPDAPITFR